MSAALHHSSRLPSNRQLPVGLLVLVVAAVLLVFFVGGQKLLGAQGTASSVLRSSEASLFAVESAGRTVAQIATAPKQSPATTAGASFVALLREAGVDGALLDAAAAPGEPDGAARERVVAALKDLGWLTPLEAVPVASQKTGELSSSSIASKLPSDDPFMEMLPPTSRVRCAVQQDASDLCEYTSACFDLPTDEAPHANPTLTLLRRGGGEVEANAAEAAAAAELEALISARAPRGYTYDYADSLDTAPWRARSRPFAATNLRVTASGADAGSSVAAGGSAPGLVTWVDDLWAVESTHGSHLWGFASTVAFPFFGGAHANISQGLQLPPLRNALLLADSSGVAGQSRAAWASGLPFPGTTGRDRWCSELLAAVLEFIAEEQAGGGGDADAELEAIAASAAAAARLFSSPRQRSTRTLRMQR